MSNYIEGKMSAQMVMNKKTGKLTLYVYPTKKQLANFMLEKGLQPKDIVNVVLS